MRDLIHKILIAQTRDIPSAMNKLKESRALLEFIAKSPFQGHPYSAYMAQETRALLSHHGKYIAHKYLSKHNHPYTYGKIIQRAKARDLHFLAKLSPITHPELEKQMRNVISQLTNDPIEHEELTDMIYEHAFRTNLFVRNNTETLKTNKTRAQLIQTNTIVSHMKSQSKHVSLEPNNTKKFIDNKKMRISVHHPILKTTLLELSHSFPKTITFKTLTERALTILQLQQQHSLNKNLTKEKRTSLEHNLLQLIVLKHTEIHLVRPDHMPKTNNAPRITTLARAKTH